VTVKRIGDLEIDQDLAFNQREWRFQRIGWLVMALVIVAGLLGAFGTGPLAEGSVGSDGDSLSLSYQRIDREERPTTLDITIGPGAIQGDRAELWIDNAFLDRVEVQTIQPEPESVQVGSDRTVFVFTVNDAEQSAHVALNFQHDGFGRVKGQIGLVNGPAHSFTVFVYP
jgi:hypothetical protein